MCVVHLCSQETQTHITQTTAQETFSALSSVFFWWEHCPSDEGYQPVEKVDNKNFFLQNTFFNILHRLFKKCKTRGRQSFLQKARIQTYATVTKNESDKVDCTFSAACYSIAQWCHEHMAQLQEELTACMHTIGHTSIQGREVQAWLTEGDTLSHWYTSLLYEKHPKMLPKLYEACTLRAIECMIASYAPTCTHIVLHSPPSSMHADLLRKTLHAYCQNSGKIFHDLSPQQTFHTNILKPWRGFSPFARESLKKYLHYLPYSCQALLRLVHWLWSLRRVLGKARQKQCHQPFPSAKKHVSICTYFPHIQLEKARKGVFYSHYFESLHKLLDKAVQNKDLHIHWLLVRVNSAQCTLSESITLKEDLQKAAIQQNKTESFQYVEEFLSYKDIGAACLRFVRLAWQARRIQKDVAPLFVLKQGQMPLWEYMRQYWQESFYGWRCLERALQRRAFTAYTQNISTAQNEHTWSLLVWENCPWERQFTQAMHETFPKSPVYAMQHSCVRQADFRYFDAKEIFFAPQTSIQQKMLPDIFCVNGLHAKHLLQQNIPQEKLVITEALRYLYLGQCEPFTSHTPKHMVRHLVLLTSYFPDEINAQIRTLATWLGTGSKLSQQLHIHIKAHPHTDVRPFLQKYHLETHRFSFFTQPLEKLWQQCHLWHNEGQGVFFWCANSTTVTLELAHMQACFCVQRAEKDFNFCPWHNLAEHFYVYDALTLEHALQKQTIPPLPRNFFALDTALNAWKSFLGIA